MIVDRSANFKHLLKFHVVCRYWNDPDVLSRMSDVFKVPGDGPSQEEIDLGEDAEEVVDGAADDKIENLHDAASAGMFAGMIWISFCDGAHSRLQD